MRSTFGAFSLQIFLIKEIRANLMLGYLYDHFQPKIIYLVRHPCAVTYSRTFMNNFGADVNDILSQEELTCKDYFASVDRQN